MKKKSKKSFLKFQARCENKSERRRIKHHMKNRCMGGSSTDENLLLLRKEKERVLHEVFENLSWYDSIIAMIRAAKMKHHEREDNRMERLYAVLKP